jgi:hypothetical protein
LQPRGPRFNARLDEARIEIAVSGLHYDWTHP